MSKLRYIFLFTQKLTLMLLYKGVPLYSIKKLMHNKKFKENNPKAFLCTHKDCNKIFTTKFSLQRHQSIHTGIKPYECQYCGKKFALSQSMREHIYCHTKERPYICGINNCKTSFRHLSELSMHRRIHPEHKPRKYHYLTIGTETSGQRNVPQKFPIFTAKSKSDKSVKSETGFKDPPELLSHETGEEVAKEKYGLDMKFLDYLFNLSHAEGGVERPRLPFPDVSNVQGGVSTE